MNKSNENICFKGEKISVTGKQLREGDQLPAFKVTSNDMRDLESSAYAGKTLVLCTVPSLDTPICAIEARRFNEEAQNLGDQVQVVFVSMDLPFAQMRWCGDEAVTNIQTASDYKYRSFGEDFGVVWQDTQLLARAVFVVAPDGTIKHLEYVGDIAKEPDYDAVLQAVKAI